MRRTREYLFLTNNSGYTPRELQQKLARMGLDVPEEHFYTSALATAAFLKDQAPGCSVFAIGEAGLLNALYDAGLTMNDVNPDCTWWWARAHLFPGYADQGGEPGHGRRQAHRRQLRRVRTHRKRHCSGLPRSGGPIEMATGKQAYFCGKPNPPDDAGPACGCCTATPPTR